MYEFETREALVRHLEAGEGLADVVVQGLDLREDPELLDTARERVRAWLQEHTVAERWAREWLRVLELPLEEIVTVLTDPGERSRDLRQTSPFAGVLDPRTRWEAWRAVGERFESS